MWLRSAQPVDCCWARRVTDAAKLRFQVSVVMQWIRHKPAVVPTFGPPVKRLNMWELRDSVKTMGCAAPPRGPITKSAASAEHHCLPLETLESRKM